MDARRRLKSPYEQEREQAVVRAIIGAAIVAYALWFQWMQPSRRGIVTLAVAVAFTTLSSTLCVWIWKHPFTRPDRIYGSMVLDFSSLALFMHFAAHWGPALIFVAPFVSIGHAYRYGRSYLLWSVLGSLIGLGAVISSTPYWQSQPGLIAGAFLVAITVPLYGLRFLRQYEQALAEAEHASKAKSLFLAKMSHEFRTPLNGVIGMVRELKNDYLPMRQREKLQIVSLAADTLHDVVSDVLDFSKIESEGLVVNHQPFDLHGLLSATVAVLSSQARQKNIPLNLHVDPSVPRWIVGDARHLRQVLVNLLGNAIKFTLEGSVSVSTSMSGDRLSIRVEDTGIGISEAAQKRVFEPFVQADDTITRRFGGTGLGLTISKQFVQAMGGSIDLESTPGKGTRFTLLLPYTVAKDREQLQQQVLGFALVGLTGPIQQRIEALLTKWGIDFTTVAPRDIQERADDSSLRGIICSDESNHHAILSLLTEKRADATFPAIVLTPPGTEPILKSLTRHGWRLVSSDVSEEELYNLVQGVADHPQAQKRGHRQKVRGRILVVDDNDVNSQISKACLERAGWSVRQATNFDEACTALSEEIFSVAMFDMHMPDATGFDLLQEAQNMLAGGPTPGFLLCTADARLELHEDALKLGFDGIVLKPFTEQSISSIVSKFAKNASPSADVVSLVSRPLHSRATQESLLDRERLAELRSMAPDFEGFWTKITADFVRDTDKLILKLLESVSSRDIHEWRDVVHAIKGNSINLGGQALYEACAKAEALPHDQVLRDGLRVSEGLRDLYNATKQALDAAIDLAA